jgi:hypothetical protein
MGFISTFPKEKHPLYQQLERCSGIYDAYFSQLDAGRGTRDLRVTMLVRSAVSPACRIFTQRADEFAARGVHVQAIFARLGPVEPLGAFLDIVRRLNGDENAAASVRWAKNPSLLDAHEQLTLGTRMCWTGDCMRRSADRRNALDLFEENSLGSVHLGELAFSSMWTASKPLPGELLDAYCMSGDPRAEAGAECIAETLGEPDENTPSAVIVKLRARG